jgi:hypothetical protein
MRSDFFPAALISRVLHSSCENGQGVLGGEQSFAISRLAINGEVPYLECLYGEVGEIIDQLFRHYDRGIGWGAKMHLNNNL